MRQIKFKCWNGEQMVSPDYITRDGTAWWKENSIPTSSKILLQFTGLLDKNGKEIYEGDIVRIPNEFPQYPHEPDYLLLEVTHDDQVCTYKIDEYWLWEYNNESEIVGNVFENPEFLKQ